MKNDIKMFIAQRRANISIKYTNICKANRNTPLSVKLDVLDTCIPTSITYTCETWGSNVSEAELCYRSGIKVALNVRENTNNEIVYIESGKYPIQCKVKRADIKCWLYVIEYFQNSPDSALSKIVKLGLENNITYLKYYENLKSNFFNPVSCLNMCRRVYFKKWKCKLASEAGKDKDSRLGTYFRINPLLEKHVSLDQDVMEIERILVTRFRTGSHSLAVELGRYSAIARENRFCLCRTNVQTVWHVFMECLITYGVNHINYRDIKEIFDDENIHRKLLLISKALKLSILIIST